MFKVRVFVIRFFVISILRNYIKRVFSAIVNLLNYYISKYNYEYHGFVIFLLMSISNIKIIKILNSFN